VSADRVWDNTLVRYHGDNRGYYGDLAFIRESKIFGDKCEYTLDVVCYHPEDMEWDNEDYITSFGSLTAFRDEFTVVPIPDIPAPFQAGNYMVVTRLWRRNTDGSWDSWEPTEEKCWRSQPDVQDSHLRHYGAIFIGPLPML
jgi:hypothetical protein